MRVFENTVLARPWQEVGDAPAWELIYARREPYPVGVVPEGGQLITAGCDVQRNRLEVEVVAWGPDMESWSVEYLVLEGETATIQNDSEKPCPWRALAGLLRRTWPTADGKQLPIIRMAVDTGDQTATVYEWIRRQHDQRVMGTKGMDAQAGILGLPKVQDVTVRGKLVKGGVKLWPMGSSAGKRELYGWLRMDQPTPGEKPPRGWTHFPEYNEDYFRGLTAEQLICRTVHGFPKWKWERIFTRNEPLDCRVMARAALAGTGADRWDAEQWEERAGKIGQKIASRLEPSEDAAPAAPAEVEASPVATVEQQEKRQKWINSRRRGKWL
jgi:phage terminase large subunit GpA-like protein